MQLRLTLLKNSINFKDVNFKYEGQDSLILDNINLEICKGQT